MSSRAVAPSGSLGRLAFGFLAVCAASGVALAPFYSAARPLESLERIQGGLPWGFFLRSLHAFSAYGLLVAGGAHLVQVLAARTERQLSQLMWWGSVLLLPLLFGALLGGYVLRADAGAAAALPVWRRVLETLPLAGREISRFIAGATSDSGAVALHHSGTFTLLLWLLTAAHGDRLLPDRRSAVLAALVSAALAGALPLPLGPSPDSAPAFPGGGLLLGPWYLLGLQGALLDLPVAAGWLAPLGLVLLLGLLYDASARTRRLLIAAVIVWAAADLAFTARILLAAGR